MECRRILQQPIGPSSPSVVVGQHPLEAEAEAGDEAEA